MSKKKRKSGCGSVLSDEFVPASLPEQGRPDLTWFSASDYSLNTDPFIETCYDVCEDNLKGIVQMSDKYTVGEVCDSYVKGMVAHIRNRHKKEVSLHEFQGQHISSAIQVRSEEIDRSTAESERRIKELDAEIEPLKGKKTMFDVFIGRFHLPIALMVTLAAMLVDGLLNYSFLSSILYQSRFLLVLTVICMSVMSDASMYVMGIFTSRRKESNISKNLSYIIIGGLVGMFLLSIAASIMVRFGSMANTYGSYNASGQFVGKDSYSLAEYGITVVTSLLTTATGLISLAVSADANAYLVDRRRKLEKERNAELASLNKLKAERTALELAADPMARDRECQAVAEANLEALEIGLKLHVRKLLALHQQDSSYSDMMSESADELYEETDNDSPIALKTNNIEITKGAV